ncbi:hypothetical protein GUITHDRAFT_137799 [Guillardia theta CCMP2712]|uniref:F-box domain-containing protein n=1 Tax=Guillardia theta (strain CCMP2712) TaxID=905079 RepID=L1JFD8_GUITC|nr:hypothetical protein GUITHDRAFT_137799 [Guillardia theta CCMP2712]EKX47216.1 hypothetical protein GUITHDRAFT_137799 [Guillardia theta CCMP2712]|eukprot:XP_005834196.1 hypothetical protein GUITHDRAFT_137799 [Guillardia theta CCMP2712]
MQTDQQEEHSLTLTWVTCICSLPLSWTSSKQERRVRYVASVEAETVSVLLRAVSINNRLVLLARVPGGPVARLLLPIDEFVAELEGGPIVTDSSLQDLIVACSKRILGPIGRAARMRGGTQGLPERFLLKSLYSELQTHILAHLAPRHLSFLACTCRKMNSLGEERGEGMDGERQLRRSAVKQLFRIPFPLNPLAPWLPQPPPRQPFFDPRFPLPWMNHQQWSSTGGAPSFGGLPILSPSRRAQTHARDPLRDCPTREGSRSSADGGSPSSLPPRPNRTSPMMLGVRGGNFGGMGSFGTPGSFR